MAKMVSEKHLIGRMIVGFEPNTFDNGYGQLAHDPIIHLDDGSRLVFVVEETDRNCYGVKVIKVRAK